MGLRTLQIKFQTRIYHPNVDDEGNICVALLKTEVWKPATKMTTGASFSLTSPFRLSICDLSIHFCDLAVLLSIYNLLIEPNPDDPLVASVSLSERNFSPLVTRR